MTRPQEYSFLRYLAAKKSVDDRALNRQVWQAFRQALAGRLKEGPLKILEVGCGIGVMLERLVESGFLKDAEYTGIDLEAACVAEAYRRVLLFAGQKKFTFEPGKRGVGLRGLGLNLSLAFEVGDCFTFAAREAGRQAWDLLAAHAFLDLVDLEEALSQLLALLKPGGWFYFTLNFDGTTGFQPDIEPELDRRIIELYHQSMVRRGPGGRLSDGSTTGRRLSGALKAAGAEILAAGGSDWAVFPQGKGYPEDEAYFLHCIIRTISQALTGNPHLEQQALEAWVDKRHAQMEAGELGFQAHNLDFFGHVP
jgi:SAM-dependent methyltransferase